MSWYAKIDEVTNLSEYELVKELWKEQPETILAVIRGDAEGAEPPPGKKTKTVVALVEDADFGADDLVDGYLGSSATRRTRAAELAGSLFSALADFDDLESQEDVLKTALESGRFSPVALAMALWESQAFADLASLLANLIEKMHEHCDDEAVLARLQAATGCRLCSAVKDADRRGDLDLYRAT